MILEAVDNVCYGKGAQKTRLKWQEKEVVRVQRTRPKVMLAVCIGGFRDGFSA
jgi:hypothetical protein